MTKLLGAVAISALILAGVTQSGMAQIPQTDEVLVLNVNLDAFSQGSTTTNRTSIVTPALVSEVTSRDIIQVLGVATGNTFSRKARLVLLTPTNDLEDWTVQIRDGSNAPVDVTGFVGHQKGSPSVTSTWVTKANGNAGEVEYSVDGFSLHDQAGFPTLSLHFNVSGFTVSSSKGAVKNRVVVGQIDRIAAQVSGSGDSNGNPTVITGSIHAEGIGTEVVTPPGPSFGAS